MKCVFLSNYYNHHQSDFCNTLHDFLKDDFCFVATSKVSEDRIKLGYSAMFPSFVVEMNEENIADCFDLAKPVAPHIEIGVSRFDSLKKHETQMPFARE